ncbi:uncharacterized protein BDZ99DRAFT_464433, partial [Mytilinidion resinicola]
MADELSADEAILLDATEEAASARAELDEGSATEATEELNPTRDVDAAMIVEVEPNASGESPNPDDAAAAAEASEATVATVNRVDIAGVTAVIAEYDATWNGCAALGCASKLPAGHKHWHVHMLLSAERTVEGCTTVTDGSARAESVRAVTAAADSTRDADDSTEDARTKGAVAAAL